MSRVKALLPFLAAACSLLLSAPSSHAGRLLQYEGEIQDGSGRGARDGAYDFELELYDSPEGGSLLWTQSTDRVAVRGGRYSVTLGEEVPLDLPAGTYWLETTINGETLSPRASVTMAARADCLVDNLTATGVITGNGSGLTNVTTSGIMDGTIVNADVNPAAAIEGTKISPDFGTQDLVTFGRVGIGTVTSTYPLEVTSNGDAAAIYATNTGVVANEGAIKAVSTSPSGRTINAFAASLSGFATGVWGAAASTDGVGVAGFANAATGNTSGVKGVANSTQGIGVAGYAAAVTGTTTGVQGASSSTGGTGVEGICYATTGINFGVKGSSDSTSGTGVDGRVTAPTGTTYGVYGSSASNTGYGVYGQNPNPTATTAAVYGITLSTVANALAIHGVVSSTSPGSGSAGVRGENRSTSAQGYGVLGTHAGSGHGVLGRSVNGNGVRAESTGTGVALLANSSGGDIIQGYGSAINNLRFKVSDTGNVAADGTITGGGADFAEMLPAATGLEPGDLLAIGPDGTLTLSSKAYQTSVAGVFSTKPGFVGGGGDADQSGKVPMAIVGIVPVKAVTENGPIRPGDLLVASSLAGHAMEAGANPPTGTVVGKALGSLEQGTGTISMLVTLQ